ncbi:N-acetylglucosamine-6-phosphate deacetylase [Loigolactobacillus coryniformis]|uniref:N-acetylglucosamine-6-phosphate deacetylase n=1 Tax=Loigolactobacillus coryniformis TaxID=1610 RepID=UPI001C5D0625|nr:N-acetylglucosamine-6-phosphate deacetylase [Loigolactobacillus coryniformis]MBW4803742.1 N-acetylglucosamine-6-phosphate deacetylase [Loigolactobacillus coryniformis subsp. torquens]MBW4806451.1 N-acetylglucosamine-6-phosphate deacetylase [Loigolactobacillus coryniformis subsp. torquens]
MSYYIHAAHFFLRHTVEHGGYLEITDEGKFGDYSSDKPIGKIVDYRQQMIAPGLVDTHIHGLLNHDVMDNDLTALQEMSDGLLQAGVTSWLPTTLTASLEQLNEVTATIGDHYHEMLGAKIQGIYYEGPFFTVKHKGAQNPEYFRDPDVDIFNKWQRLAHGLVKKIALAPERNGAVEFTKAVSQQGVAIALGHTDATYEQAKVAIDAGATVFTHAFNGMRGFDHRAPGMAGAAMVMRGVTDELICDGHHVHPKAAEILFDAQGAEHIAMITDCMRAGLMPDGDYVLGEYPVIVANGMARLKQGGSLAGSVLQLKDAIKNVVDWGFATPAQAILMASAIPAQSCCIDDQCGQILPGRAADFIVLNANMTLAKTYLDGVLRYQE